MLRRYPAGSILRPDCSDEDEAAGLLYVASGALRAGTLSAQGREITLFRVGEDECCVSVRDELPPRRLMELQFAVEEDAELLVLPASAFRELAAGNLHVRCFGYARAAAQYAAVVAVMEEILFAPFDQRLAGYLLERCAASGSTQISMTQEQIAQNVNSAREVVARMLKQFAVEGLIENRRGEVVLRDIAGLRKLVK